ncbi:unnamed protein product [Closterium sp. Naga37s-1]|nr:unnamed protein product [Closterium sp. Naga37s-1]
MCRPPDVIPGAAQSEAEEELDARWRAQQIDDAAAAYGGAWNWNPMTAPGGRLFGGNAGMYGMMSADPSQMTAMQTRQPLQAQWLLPQHAQPALPKPPQMQPPTAHTPSAQQMFSMSWPPHAAHGMSAPSPILAAKGPLGYMSQGMAQGMAQGIPCGLPQEMEFHAGDMGAMSTDGLTAEELADLDPKKHKRMMSNRASAKRSRQRKQERLEELEIQSAKLRVENAAVTRRLNEASDHIRQYQESNDRLQNELKRLRDALTRADVPVANKPTDAAADAGMSADFALKVFQAGKREVAEPSAEGAGNKRARLVATTSFEESEEEGVHSPSAITGASAPPSHAEGVAADAAVVANGANRANAGNDGLARACAMGAGLTGVKEMGVKDADTLADAEFLAGLIGCFDDGKPLEALI